MRTIFSFQWSADEEPPFVNIESLGDGKFGINLAKLDANGAVLVKIHRSLGPRAEHDWQQWEYYEYNILEPYSATVNYPVMPDILICYQLRRKRHFRCEGGSTRPDSDGSEVVGDNSLFDLSNFSSSVNGVFNENIVGTSHDDVIMSEVGSVYISWW